MFAIFWNRMKIDQARQISLDFVHSEKLATPNSFSVTDTSVVSASIFEAAEDKMGIMGFYPWLCQVGINVNPGKGQQII